MEMDRRKKKLIDKILIKLRANSRGGGIDKW